MPIIPNSITWGQWLGVLDAFKNFACRVDKCVSTGPAALA